MVVYTAKRKGRILVWPSHSIAHAADTDGSKHSEGCTKITVWPDYRLAEQNKTFDDSAGGAPEWVPENAVIHIDFVNDRAWTEADGEVAIDTLVGADPNTENGWGTSGYNPSELTEDGLVYTDYPALIGAARDLLVAAATFAIRWKQVDDSAPLVLISADGDDALSIEQRGSPTKLTARSFSGSLSNDTANALNSTPGVNTVAATITLTRFDIALNGTAAVAGVVSSSDRPPGNPLVAVVIDTNGPLQTITIYDPLPDTDGLSELSSV